MTGERNILMSDKKMKTGNFDEFLIESLQDRELALEYLNEAALDGDYRVFLSALRNVAKAIGYSELSKMTGLERTSLYKMLSVDGNPTISSFYDLLGALGVRVQLVDASEKLAPKVTRPSLPPEYTCARGCFAAKTYATYEHEEIDLVVDVHARMGAPSSMPWITVSEGLRHPALGRCSPIIPETETSVGRAVRPLAPVAPDLALAS